MSASPPASVTLPPNSARLHTLDNGLEVILLEDKAHPLASVQFWVKAGSLHEEKWTGAGLAHLVEHMFFKGTERRTAQQISQEIQALGGYVNAYTTFNRTVYWIDGVSQNVDGYLDILSDMARCSTFNPEELVKEQEVIRREFAMDNDDPQSAVQHVLQRMAFRDHPLQHPIIGHIEVFNQVGREDVVNFVQRHYAPNNCFVVIAGDIDQEEALAAVTKHFGTWQRRPYAPVLMPEEPEQASPRHFEKEFNTDIVRLSMGWHIHGDSHPDKPALDVLGFILGSGRSSRLNRELRDKLGIAHWVGSGAWSALDRGLFAIEAECDAEDLAEVEAAIARVVDEIKENGCKKDELDKAVSATLSHQFRTRSTTRGLASSLAHSWLNFGNLDQDRAYLERIRALQIADIVNAAHTYLKLDRVTRVSLHPKGTLSKKSNASIATKREEAQRYTLSNGMTLLVGENPRLPLVSTRVQFLAGVPVETDANAGVTQVTAQWLLKGTEKHTDEQIAAMLEDRGGSLLSNGDAHRLFVGADVMKGDESLAFSLLSEVLHAPSFPDSHLGKIKKRQMAAIREEQEDPLTVAMRKARKEMFAGQPFHRSAMGTLESIEALKVETCRSLWQQQVQGRNGVISVFGDVKAAEVFAQAELLFGTLPSGEKSTAGFASLPLTAKPGRWDLKLDKEQGVLVLAFPTVGLQDPSAAALHLIDEACSDMGSRLFNRIREELGLAYYIGTQAFHALGAGAFYFYCGTDPQKIDQVEEELLKQIADLAANGLQEDELARAKTTWKSSWLRQQQGNGAMADALAWDELNGHGYQRHQRLPEIVEAVTPDQIREAAARFFTAGGAYTVSVRP
jgi:zinc protease